MAGEPGGLRAALLRRALDRRPPRRGQTVGSAKTASSASAGWIDISRTTVTPSRSIHAAWSRTATCTCDRARTPDRAGGEPIEVIRSLVVGDGRHRCLQTGHVRFERDRHLVAEAALYPRADRAQEPRGGGRHAEANGRDPRQPGRALDDGLAEQHEPEREQRIRQGREQRQDEAAAHQARLVPIAERAQPPHGRQRRRQRVEPGGDGAAVRRGRHRPALLVFGWR